VLTLCVVACSVALVRSQTTSDSEQLIPRSRRQAAADFSTLDANGNRVALSRFRGRVVLLDFWATWCTGCKVEIPWYVAFQQRYGSKGLTSIGAAVDDEGWDVVHPYITAHPISYPIVLGDAAITTKYNVTNLPVTLLIDRAGRIAQSHLGLVDRDKWEHAIRLLLAEPAT
jgi:cytochrome c biogenesis protein CcmG/thiol:disulfide interchange protein DsbE